jgi:hypothetical protein
MQASAPRLSGMLAWVLSNLGAIRSPQMWSVADPLHARRRDRDEPSIDLIGDLFAQSLGFQRDV